MNISELIHEYKKGKSVKEHLLTCRTKALENNWRNTWITILNEEQLVRYIDLLPSRPTPDYPLYGVPFAIKDNIDLEAVPTTAGCPAFSYTPEKSAFIVKKLVDAGAIPLGKTNMDQFATGLVGTRSPYGACKNYFNEEKVSGGSSSGSAVSVAAEEVLFSLGTDTAGSGRVPAAFHGIYGMKPSRGLVSCSGVVPACRSLDCVSIFTNNLEDLPLIQPIAFQYDHRDAFARMLDVKDNSSKQIQEMRIGIPDKDSLEFYGNDKYAECFQNTIEQIKKMYSNVQEIEYSLFKNAAKLLYEGPWVAERYVALESFIQRYVSEMDKTVRAIITPATDLSAVSLFKSQYKLAEIKRRTEDIWSTIDVLITPTTTKHPTINEVNDDPIMINSQLGEYTNHMNLLDLCGLAIPAGSWQENNKTEHFGVTLQAPAGKDKTLVSLARKLKPIAEP